MELIHSFTMTFPDCISLTDLIANRYNRKTRILMLSDQITEKWKTECKETLNWKAVILPYLHTEAAVSQCHSVHSVLHLAGESCLHLLLLLVH